MRIYIEGKLSSPQECFALSRLFFGNTNDVYYDTDFISEHCFSLEADEYESALSDDKLEFSVRWKGVTTGIEKNDEIILIEDGDISLADIIKLIQKGNKTLVNGEAYYDTTVDCTITKITFVQTTFADDGKTYLGETRFTIEDAFDSDILKESISFVADYD